MLLLKNEITSFVSTNLAQPVAEWLPKNTYNAGDYAMKDHHEYLCITNHNKGIDPTLNTGRWLMMQVANASACIDVRSETYTHIDKGLNHIEITFDAIGFDTLAFEGVVGGVLTVIEKDSKGHQLKHKDYKAGAVRICSKDWWHYFYCPIPNANAVGSKEAMDILIEALDPKTSTITIKLTKNGDGVSKIGSMVGGKSLDMGATEFGVDLELIDYSIIKRDKNGIIEKMEHRDCVEKMSVECTMPAKASMGIKRTVKKELANPCLFIVDPSKDSNYENLIILGFITKYKQVYNNNVIVKTIVDIEELI